MTLGFDKYNWTEHRDHFILADAPDEPDFGEPKQGMYALQDTQVLVQKNKEVRLAAHEYGKGRGVYISGLPYSFENARLLHRAILWSAHAEDQLHVYYSDNPDADVHAYVKYGRYCVVNNTYEPQDTHKTSDDPQASTEHRTGSDQKEDSRKTHTQGEVITAGVIGAVVGAILGHNL